MKTETTSPLLSYLLLPPHVLHAAWGPTDRPTGHRLVVSPLLAHPSPADCSNSLPRKSTRRSRNPASPPLRRRRHHRAASFGGWFHSRGALRVDRHRAHRGPGVRRPTMRGGVGPQSSVVMRSSNRVPIRNCTVCLVSSGSTTSSNSSSSSPSSSPVAAAAVDRRAVSEARGMAGLSARRVPPASYSV